MLPNLFFRYGTGCSVNIVFFPQNIVIFLNSASSSAAELVFYLPGVSTHTDTRENRERPEFGIFQNLRNKHNI